MAIVYATLIVKGMKTLEEVPELIKSNVEAIIEALEVQL
ncbi:CD1375 family protein [Bengtsoniella intestinalis]